MITSPAEKILYEEIHQALRECASADLNIDDTAAFIVEQLCARPDLQCYYTTPKRQTWKSRT